MAKYFIKNIATFAVLATAVLSSDWVLAQSTIRLDDFSSNFQPQTLPKNWEKKTIKFLASEKGEEYQFFNKSNEHYIRMATGPGNFFSLSPKRIVLPVDYPILAWEWKVSRFPSKTKIKNGLRSDKAASICLFDNYSSKLKYRAVCYAWELDSTKDVPLLTPGNKRIYFIILRTQKSDKKEQWYPEKRNLQVDFKKIWKKEPREGRIVLFVDSDTSKSNAEAAFRKIIISKTP